MTATTADHSNCTMSNVAVQILKYLVYKWPDTDIVLSQAKGVGTNGGPLTVITSRVLKPSIRSLGQASISRTAETVPLKMTQELHANKVVSKIFL